VVVHLYHYDLARQKFRYEIVKNRPRNSHKRLYFDLKIANFIQWLGDPHSLRRLHPQSPTASGDRASRVGFSTFCRQRRGSQFVAILCERLYENVWKSVI